MQSENVLRNEDGSYDSDDEIGFTKSNNKVAGGPVSRSNLRHWADGRMQRKHFEAHRNTGINASETTAMHAVVTRDELAHFSLNN